MVWGGFWEGFGRGLGCPGRLLGHFSISFCKALWLRGPKRRRRGLLGSILSGFGGVWGGVWEPFGRQN